MDISSLRERNIRDTLTVSELNGYIKRIFDSDRTLSSVSVKGEISNFTYHRSGHLYFTLKDEEGQIKSVMFRSSAGRLKFMPENGMRVVVHGSVAVYQRDGTYQIYVNTMEPDGVGALYLAYEQLKEKLYKEGLFDELHKKALPEYPERIGVITSPTGAAVRDIINVLGRRFPIAKIYLYPSLVQGEVAVENLIAALDYFEKTKLADVIIIGRGGGSIEDLWAFNEECVALAVSRSEIPVISAVGHETDFTICDFVADMRAPTPSAAAEIAVPDRREQLYYVNGLSQRLSESMFDRISQGKLYIDTLLRLPILKNPLSFVENGRQTLDSLLNRLLFAQKNIIAEKTVSFASYCSKLDALSPLKVLSRGYAAVYSGDKVAESASAVDMNIPLKVRFNDGEIVCQPKTINVFDEVK